MEQWPDVLFSSLAHGSLEIHCSYRLKFFVAKNHLRSSSLSNCSSSWQSFCSIMFNTPFSKV